MALDDKTRLVIDGLSILNDPRPNPAQPTIDTGIHLRWSFGAQSAFPLHGYYLFRRDYSEGNERCLSTALIGVKTGAVPGNAHDSWYGRAQSAELVAVDRFDPPGAVELALDDFPIEITFPAGVVAQKIRVTLGFGQWAGGQMPQPRLIDITLRHGTGQPAVTQLMGMPGQRVTMELGGGGITGVVIGKGTACLIELCYWFAFTHPSVTVWTGSSVPGPWHSILGFSYPKTLPITHPLYPPQTGAETLVTHRGDGPQRIRYGTANDALPLHAPSNGAGTISLTPGSPLAKGTNTAWDESFVGRILYPDTISTAFSVMAVPAPDRLVLSRPFTGAQPLQNVHYKWSDEDAFAQLHDQLGALLSEPDGMRGTAMPPPIERASPQRKATLADGSALAHGQGTSWTKDLEGLLFEPASTKALYRIVSVDVTPQILTLHANYIGPPGPSQYRVVSRSPDNDVESKPALSISPLDYLELASLHPAYAQLLGLYWNDRSVVDEAPLFDYIVIADHDGRFQQRADLALKWLNTVADFSGTGVDGAILTGIAFAGSGALAPPAAASIYALPGGTPAMTPDRPDLADSTPGLSIGDTDMPVMFDVWRYGHGTQMPAPGAPRPAQDHAQVGERFLPNRRKSDPAAPRPPGWPDPALIHFIDTTGGGLDVGWYSYRAGATDYWGRMSVLSAPIPWIDPAGTTKHPHAVHLEDRTPPPPPTDLMAWLLEPHGVPDPSRVADAAYKAWRAQSGIGPSATGLRLRWRWPWSHQLAAPDLQEFHVYAQSTPINARLHKIVSVVAASVDPTRSDVTLAESDNHAADAYKDAALQFEERSFAIEKSTGGANLVLRVRNGGPTGSVPPPSDAVGTIVLPPGHALHRDLLDAANWERFLGAPSPSITYDIDPVEDPNVKLFDDPSNALHGTSAVWGQSRVRLDDLQSSLAAVRPGIDVIALGSDDTSLYAVLPIASVDAVQKEIVPDGGGPIWLTPGTYRWAIGPARKDARGTAATWNAALNRLGLDGNPDLSNVQTGADRIYVRVDATSTLQELHHFFDIDEVDGTHLVLRGALSLLTNGATYEWRIGKPVRIYELFLPSATAGGSDDPKLDDWLNASLDEPVVYATIGVSGVDKRANEGKLGGPATIFRVQRALPAAPPDDVWDASRLQATRADYFGKSFFTVRWKKPDAAKRPHYKAVVLRAMDETLFMEDFGQSRTFPLTLSIPSHWSASRAADVTADFSASGAYGTIRTKSSLDDALPLYRALSDDAVAVLANLPGNEEEAFSERTLNALSLIDPANDDRRGPDDDLATFAGVNANLNAWLDELDGRSQNRYLYKVAYVDSAHNRGPLGKSSPPVYLPKVVPPRPPVITKVLGGELRITLKWAANREPDLAGYRVYRTDDESKAAEIRSMDLVHSPAAADVEWTDDDANLVPGRKYFYRLTAVDASGNESAPTRAHPAIAVDTRTPAPPKWTDQKWLLRRTWDDSFVDWPSDNIVLPGHRPALRVAFRCDVSQAQFMLTRRRGEQPDWLPPSRAVIVRNPIDEFAFHFVDDDVEPTVAIAYRIKARSASGVWSTEYALLPVTAPEGVQVVTVDEP